MLVLLMVGNRKWVCSGTNCIPDFMKIHQLFRKCLEGWPRARCAKPLGFQHSPQAALVVILKCTECEVLVMRPQGIPEQLWMYKV
jgi:hypothetical protein